MFARRIVQTQARSLFTTATRSYKVLHTSQAKAVGGRKGVVTSNDGAINLKLDLPTGLGGQGGPGTNPEQLFAAGYSACFRGAMNVAAQKLKLPAVPDNAEVEGIVDIGRHENQTLGIQAQLKVKIDGWKKEDVQKLINEAHNICPYSHATRGNIKVTLTVV